MKNIIVCALALSACLSAFCADISVVFEDFSKNKTERKYALEKMPDGAMRLTVPVRDISRETKSVRVLSSDYTAQKGEDGYFITPSLPGNRAFFVHDSGKYDCLPQMKFWGAKTPRGTYLAIAKGLDLEYLLTEEVVGGVHKLYPTYQIDKIDFDPYEDIVIDFYDLGASATYVDMAKKYRQYKLDSGAVVPLRERVKNNPALKYTVGAPFVRVKLAHNKRPKGMAGANDPAWDKIKHELHIKNTFDDFMNIMRKMKAAGVNEADMCFVGWHTGGFDGYFPDLFPVEERLGGEAKMREAVELGKSLGYHMTTHINNHNMYKRAKRWSDAYVSKNRAGEPRTYVVWPGGQAFHTCFQTICDRFIDPDIDHLKAMGMNAPQHVDVTSAIRPTPCCDPLHPNNRKEMAGHQIRLGHKYHKVFGGFTSEAGFDHVAPILDYALYTCTSDHSKAEIKRREKRLGRRLRSRPLMELEILPLWQIVYHGIILSNADWNTIDCYIKPKGDKMRLKFIECGGRPTFYWTDYKKQSDIDAIAESYRDYVKMRHLQYEFIDRHGEIAKDVFLTGYSDGSEVVVNYSKEPFKYRGATVAARDFLLYPPAKK